MKALVKLARQTLCTKHLNRLAIVLGGLVALAVFLIWPHWTIALAIFVAGLAGVPVLRFLRRRRIIWLASRIVRQRSDHASSEDDVEPRVESVCPDADDVDDFLAGSETCTEVVIASFDQNNRVLPYLGGIDPLDEPTTTTVAFQPRSRNDVDLVRYGMSMCIRKIYGSQVDFASEVIALDALRNVNCVPALIAADAKRRTTHQSFIRGRNLGNILAERGITVSMQHRIAVAYPPTGNGTSPTMNSDSEWGDAVQAVHDVIGSKGISQLCCAFEQIHAAGVILGDIKYGNVIIADGDIYICDFDRAVTYRHRTPRFRLERECERRKIEYTFGTTC